MNKRVTVPTNTRFSEELKARVHTLASAFRLTPSEIIRQAVEDKVREWEAADELVLRRRN